MQVRAKLAFELRAALVSVPEVARAPLQLPLAEQAVALLALHVKAVVPPGLTELGLAVRVSVGAAGPDGVTETRIVLEAAPPAPLQVSE